MSEVQGITALPTGVAELPANTVSHQPEHIHTDRPTAPASSQAAAASEDVIAPVEDKKMTETLPPSEQTIEPMTEGQLVYRGPGLVKSLMPSKKEFWLSESPIPPQHMDLYMRGEKPEISHPVVAWATETGKGLLFFNKKGDTNRTHPSSVLALYDAVDLKKAQPHEISFRLHGHAHSLKAANDAERDGWFASIEKTVESGKAMKESVRASEGYKAEMEKLNKQNIGSVGAAGAAGTVRSKSQPKKSAEIDRAEGARRNNSDAEREELPTKAKSRSTSRGVLGRLTGRKADGVVEKKEEKAAMKEEKREEKAEKQEANDGSVKPEEQDGTAVLAGGATLDAAGIAERVIGAPVTEDAIADAETAAVDSASKSKETPKPAKRGSIFGRMSSGFGSMMTPTKEKDLKDAELKPQAPVQETAATDAVAAENDLTGGEPVSAGVLPEGESALSESANKPAEIGKEPADVAAPKGNSFLSSLPFLNKRNRSVSPSPNTKEIPLQKEEAPTAPAKDTAAVEEPIEPAADYSSPVKTDSEKPMEKVEEPLTTEIANTTTTANKRQSVFGNIGRRASKVIRGMGQTPRKENATPVHAAAEKEHALQTASATEKPVVNGESKLGQSEQQPHSIGDVVPEAITVGERHFSTPTVTASA